MIFVRRLNILPDANYPSTPGPRGRPDEPARPRQIIPAPPVASRSEHTARTLGAGIAHGLAHALTLGIEPTEIVLLDLGAGGGIGGSWSANSEAAPSSACIRPPKGSVRPSLESNVPAQPGTDFRVHVLDEHVFATEIRSHGDDYRYAALTGSDPELRAARLPDDVAASCCRVARALRLTFAGIDLRRTPAGEWYCFEANPSPGFSYYQKSTGQLIDLAVARYLAGDGHRTNGVRQRRASRANGTSANSLRPDERRSRTSHAP
jgi:RimK-like ATP-grasp domain